MNLEIISTSLPSALSQVSPFVKQSKDSTIRFARICADHLTQLPQMAKQNKPRILNLAKGGLAGLITGAAIAATAKWQEKEAELHTLKENLQNAQQKVEDVYQEQIKNIEELEKTVRENGASIKHPEECQEALVSMRKVQDSIKITQCDSLSAVDRLTCYLKKTLWLNAQYQVALNYCTANEPAPSLASQFSNAISL